MNELQSYFAHLIEGAGIGLKSASCVYVDGISRTFSIKRLIDSVLELFYVENEKVRSIIVDWRDEDKKPKSLGQLLNAIDECSLADRIKTLQFFPRARSSNEAAWEPSIYFGLRIADNCSSAFFSVNSIYSIEKMENLALQLSELSDACAAYVYYFPQQFSPLAYHWGISVDASNGGGQYTRRDSERIVRWRDNCQTGIMLGGHRRFFRVCDGFVRDTYPLMIISKKHAERRVNSGLTLDQAISSNCFGALIPAGRRFVWRIPVEKLLIVQEFLDENDVSLSGRLLNGEVAGFI